MRVSKGFAGGGNEGVGTYPYSLGIWMKAIVTVVVICYSEDFCGCCRCQLLDLPALESGSERIGQLLYACRVAKHSFVKPSRCP
jgi:hypothetical protein